jgi:hypothetical protein
MGRFRFPISVPYIALVELLPFTSYYRFSAKQNQTGSENQPYVTPPTKINITERSVAVGFLLVLYTLRSSNSHRSRVIIDFQLSTTKTGSGNGSHLAPPTGKDMSESIGCCAFSISVLYIALV